MVDAIDSKSVPARGESSSLSSGTKWKSKKGFISTSRVTNMK